MKSGLITFRIKPGMMDQFVSSWNSMLAEITPQTMGLETGILLTNPQTQTCMAMGLWSSQGEAQAWVQNPIYLRFMNQVSDWLLSTPTREIWDVRGYFVRGMEETTQSPRAA